MSKRQAIRRPVAVFFIVLISGILSSCNPAQEKLASDNNLRPAPAFETTVTLMPAEEKLKTTAQATNRSELPTSTAPARLPTSKPTQQPSPTPTRTEIPTTPTNTLEPSPTPEGVWCNNVAYDRSESSNAAWNKLVLDFRKKVLNLISQGKDPAKEPVTNPVGLITKIWRSKAGRCGFRHTEQKNFDQALEWKFNLEQIERCKQQTLEPLTEDGWYDPKFWFFTDNEKGWQVRLNFKEDGSSTCEWVREPYTE